MIERPDYVRVTNNNKLKIRGRYDGLDYEFRPGESEDIPLAAAAHIFGFGQENKHPALRRLGWFARSEDEEMAMTKLRLVVFKDAPPLVAADIPEPVEAIISGQGKQTGPVSPETSGEGAAGGKLPAAPKPQK